MFRRQIKLMLVMLENRLLEFYEMYGTIGNNYTCISKHINLQQCSVCNKTDERECFKIVIASGR